MGQYDPTLSGVPQYGDGLNPYQVNDLQRRGNDPNSSYNPDADEPQFADADRSAQQHPVGAQFGRANRDMEAGAGGTFGAGPHHGGNGFGDTSPYTDPTDFQWGGYARGADDSVTQYQEMADAAAARSAPQIQSGGWMDARAQDDASAAAQANAASLYGRMASGYGPSVAAAQMGAARDSVLAQQLASSGSPYASSSAGASGMNAHIARLGEARGVEAAAAMGAQGTAQQDALRGAQARLASSQQMAMRQAEIQMSQRAQNDAMVRAYGDLGYNVRAAQLAGAEGFESQEAYSRLSEMGLMNGAQQARQAAQTQQFGATLGGIGAAAAAGQRMGASMPVNEDDSQAMQVEPDLYGEG